jgi:hypothetical protein
MSLPSNQSSTELSILPQSLNQINSQMQIIDSNVYSQIQNMVSKINSQVQTMESNIDSLMQTMNSTIDSQAQILHHLEERVNGFDVLHRKSNTPSSASGLDWETQSSQAQLNMNILQSRQRQVADLRDCIQSVS